MSDCKTVDFFLGANTPQGFYSYFDAFDEPKECFSRYLIKGGPGSGKSSLMKKVCAAAKEQAAEGIIERIHCSSDADSLDAVILPQAGCAIFDATPPHAVEPRYPGAYDRMVSITECWDNEKLAQNVKPIVAVSKKISALHGRCQALLSAARMLLDQNALLLAGQWQQDKLSLSAQRFAKRVLKGCEGNGYAESVRMLSAFTNKGVVTYEQTVLTLADQIVCIKDPYGTVSDAYIRAVRAQAVKQGLSVILCMSALDPQRVEHILLPQCGVAVLTQSRYQKFTHCESMQIIRTARFLRPKALKQVKGKLYHRCCMTDLLVKDALEALRQAKALHDELETYYIAAMNFAKVDALGEQVTAEILARMG